MKILLLGKLSSCRCSLALINVVFSDMIDWTWSLSGLVTWHFYGCFLVPKMNHYDHEYYECLIVFSLMDNKICFKAEIANKSTCNSSYQIWQYRTKWLSVSLTLGTGFISRLFKQKCVGKSNLSNTVHKIHHIALDKIN